MFCGIHRATLFNEFKIMYSSWIISASRCDCYRWIMCLIALSAEVRSRLSEITTPFFVLQGSDDKLCHPDGAQMLYDSATSANKLIKVGCLHDRISIHSSCQLSVPLPMFSSLPYIFCCTSHMLYRRQSKSTEKAKIRPLATPKPLNQSLPKLACVIKSWTLPGTQNFIALPSGVSAPHIRDFVALLG